MNTELATREQGLIRADTVQQAQAQMITAMREVMSLEAPIIEIRSTEMLPVEPFGDAVAGVSYGICSRCVFSLSAAWRSWSTSWLRLSRPAATNQLARFPDTGQQRERRPFA